MLTEKEIKKLWNEWMKIPKPGINFIHESRSNKDKELFFGPIMESEKFIVFDDTWTMGRILVEADLMPSVTQARKQGQERPIPEGFTIGRENNKKAHKNFWILK